MASRPPDRASFVLLYNPCRICRKGQVTETVLQKAELLKSALMAQHQEITRFLLAGGIATFLGYVGYALLLWLGMGYLFAMAWAYVLGYGVNFLLGRYWVFQAGTKVSHTTKEILWTASITVVGLLLNLLLVAKLSQPPLALNLYLSGALAMGLVTIWNYLARKWWVYQ